MKIGVTGGTGFIGQYLLKEYSDRYEFVVLTSGNSYKKVLEKSSIAYLVSDYSEDSIQKCLYGCDGIVHLAARRSSAENEKAFGNYHDNIVISENVFNAARMLGIDNVINISSTAVYGYDMAAPFTEEAEVCPLSFYGVSKRTVEMIASMYNKKYNMHIKSLRLAQVIGDGERAGNMLSVFKERCRNHETLDVFGHGKSGKEYVYVKDVVNAIMAALNHPEKTGVYNIGLGKFTPNRELAETFCKVFNNAAGYRLLTEKNETVINYYMDVKKSESEIGFKCSYNLEAAIEDMKRVMEENICD